MTSYQTPKIVVRISGAFLAFLMLTTGFMGQALAGDTAAAKNTVLVMGDSLSAAYGFKASQGWVALTNERIKVKHPEWKVVNASISGETTAGGASRIQAALKNHKPDVIVIELGANDGLRGLSLKQTKDNLDRMITASKTSGVEVLLLGMRMPPNLGRDYTQGFERNYSDLAKKHKIAFVPFLLEPIMTEKTSFQADQLHPTAAVQGRLRDHVWPTLAPLLD